MSAIKTQTLPLMGEESSWQTKHRARGRMQGPPPMQWGRRIKDKNINQCTAGRVRRVRYFPDEISRYRLRQGALRSPPTQQELLCPYRFFLCIEFNFGFNSWQPPTQDITFCLTDVGLRSTLFAAISPLSAYTLYTSYRRISWPCSKYFGGLSLPVADWLSGVASLLPCCWSHQGSSQSNFTRSMIDLCVIYKLFPILRVEGKAYELTICTEIKAVRGDCPRDSAYQKDGDSSPFGILRVVYWSPVPPLPRPCSGGFVSFRLHPCAFHVCFATWYTSQLSPTHFPFFSPQKVIKPAYNCNGLVFLFLLRLLLVLIELNLR